MESSLQRERECGNVLGRGREGKRYERAQENRWKRDGERFEREDGDGEQARRVNAARAYFVTSLLSASCSKHQQ